jgi:SNF family Na+-dependent transporter
MGKNSFLLAAIGSAIGLGNFWRFPSLVNKFGGAGFLIPYLLALFLLGVPMLLLELGLGQKFQSGDIGVFRSIHPKLAGIGIASIYTGYVITWYYCVILGWAIRYFFESFKNPLPWDPLSQGKGGIRTGAAAC